ncbi:hypothetical protein [Paraburkholderia silvatlantica]|uniref:Uncharacterized protein n=1 Tax=Paraburkholderia silvatlantica TaxID=321895 RepID=A0ABR6FYD7_9BURK|nr:hypothetical protein [Paraburkholderia silvatlantica]MBB2932442.1 hypothetical protein [Paraburkholderia silvatlantica]
MGVPLAFARNAKVSEQRAACPMARVVEDPALVEELMPACASWRRKPRGCENAPRSEWALAPR